MSISVYDQSIARMSHMLQNLDDIVTKAEAYAEANNIEPSVLLQARQMIHARERVGNRD